MRKEQVSQFHKNAGLVDAGKIVKTATDAVAANTRPIQSLAPLTPGNYEKVGNVQMPSVPNGGQLASKITKTVQDGLKAAGVDKLSSMAPTALGGARSASRTPRMPRTPRAPRMPRSPRY